MKIGKGDILNRDDALKCNGGTETEGLLELLWLKGTASMLPRMDGNK